MPITVPVAVFGELGKDAAKIAFDDDLIYREIVRPITQRKIPMQQILRKEALEVFKAWQAKADKVRY